MTGLAFRFALLLGGLGTALIASGLARPVLLLELLK